MATNRPDGSDYAVAKAALAQAKATLLVAAAKLDATVIRAPADGMLIARSVEPGHVAEAGKELMALAPAGETQLVLEIDEKHLAELAIGQKALGSADAFPAQRFAAELVYINPGIDPARGAVEVKLRVPNPPAYLRQDMTVSVDIEVARRADAIVVPSDALHDAASAEPWALVVRDRHTVRQPVKLGLRGDERTEVIEGIAAGDALVPVTNVTIEAGRRVRGVAIVAEREPMNRFVPFECIAAIRFMREGLIQTILIIVGVALGVSVIVFMSALLGALQTNLFRRTLNYQAQIVILPPEEVARPLRPSNRGTMATLVQPRSQRLRSIDQWQKVQEQVARLPDVVAITPIVSGPGFALRGDANKAVTITGIESESYLRVIALADKIVAGKAAVATTDIVIGIELAADLGTNLGDKLRLTTASGSAETMTVTGIFDFGNKGVNERNVYIAFRDAQNLLDLAGGASSIELNVRDPFMAEDVAQTIAAATALEADSWIKTNAQFFSAISAQTLSNSFIRFFVALTAALGIASVLVVSVVQKSREIGILRAMGTSRGQVLRLFLIQGALMGLVGSLFGSAMGWLFLDFWRGIAKNPDGTPLFVVTVEPMLFVMAAAGATLIGTLAAVVPARSAARLDPVVAIRG